MKISRLVLLDFMIAPLNFGKKVRVITVGVRSFSLFAFGVWDKFVLFVSASKPNIDF